MMHSPRTRGHSPQRRGQHATTRPSGAVPRRPTRRPIATPPTSDPANHCAETSARAVAMATTHTPHKSDNTHFSPSPARMLLGARARGVPDLPRRPCHSSHAALVSSTDAPLHAPPRTALPPHHCSLAPPFLPCQTKPPPCRPPPNIPAPHHGILNAPTSHVAHYSPLSSGGPLISLTMPPTQPPKQGTRFAHATLPHSFPALITYAYLTHSFLISWTGLPYPLQSTPPLPRQYLCFPFPRHWFSSHCYSHPHCHRLHHVLPH
ncbi:hypothetical protein E2C01_010956 [Portunus trituberculatus]|uniref:Uncharacterized protein n=1 Tax=Portunus trituberculatus TaxID=210409 RepID=A0A5B7D9T6_PORTR|nr:hypothetical protein [Portunus trituberculatus]